MKQNFFIFFQYIFQRLYLFYPFITTFFMFVILVETFTYFGSMSKFLYVNSRFAFVIIILFSFVTLYKAITDKHYKIPQNQHYLLFLSNVTMPIVFVLNYLLVVSEAENYPNYIFSTYHINLLVFRYLFMSSILIFGTLNLSMYIISARRKNFKIPLLSLSAFKISSKKNGRSLAAQMAVIILLMNLSVLFITNISDSISKLIVGTSFIIQHLHYSKEEKLRNNWGFFYDYMKFISENTPESATIAIPPAQNHWLSDGNSVLVRYFLYPRKIVNLKETESLDTLYQMPKEPYGYVLLTQGTWEDNSVPYGWPKIRLPAKEIKYFTKNDGKISVLQNHDYKPEEFENTNKWGYIKIQ